jgi:hypothetical protein
MREIDLITPLSGEQQWRKSPRTAPPGLRGNCNQHARSDTNQRHVQSRTLRDPRLRRAREQQAECEHRRAHAAKPLQPSPRKPAPLERNRGQAPHRDRIHAA